MKRTSRNSTTTRGASWHYLETPEGVFTWAGLTREFYERFALALGWPAEITRHAPVAIAWRGRNGGLENLTLRPYLRPVDFATSDRPAIVRLHINRLALWRAGAAAKRLGAEVGGGAYARPPDNHEMELSCLPGEAIALAPWTAARVQLAGSGHEDALGLPPVQLQEYQGILNPWWSYCWTAAAWSEIEAYNHRADEEQRRRLMRKVGQP